MLVLSTGHIMAALQLFVTLLFLIKCSSSVFGAELTFRDDYNYNKELKIFFKLHNDHLSWDEARDICDAEGAMLAYPENVAEAIFISNLFSADKTLWLGAHNLFLSDQFATLNGEKIANKWTNWLETPELNESERNCVALITKPEIGLRLSHCHLNKSSVCFKRVDDLTPNQACQNYDPDYVPSPENTECYKVHTEAKTWNEAYLTCQIEGGNLAVMNHKYKVRFLQDLYSTHPQYDSLSHVFIGYKRIFHDQSWVNVFGKLLSRENYIKLADDNNQNRYGIYGNGINLERSENNCGTLTNEGRLHAYDCDETKMFICERKLTVPTKILAFISEDHEEVPKTLKPTQAITTAPMEEEY